MKAVRWYGKRDVRVEEVPDPTIQQPEDAVIRVTSSGICGSDLHLYEVMSPFMQPGDILGHEPMGVVEEVGPAARDHVQPGDRVVVPFNIACGRCWMCRRQLYAQCETTQNREQGKGGSLFGYTDLYGHVDGAQAEFLRVPQAHFGPIKVPEGPPDDRFVYLSDILATGWQAAKYADIPPGAAVAVFGLGPVGQFSARSARLLGAETVYGVDVVPERLAMARRAGVETVDARESDHVPDRLREATGGRGPDSVIDAVGMESRGNPVARVGQQLTSILPHRLSRPMAGRAAVDRLQALTDCIDAVRRGGTVSITGVYSGALDPLPLREMFDKGIQLRMGQCHVRRWLDELLPMLFDEADPFQVDDLASHYLPLEQAPHAYEVFQKKREGCTKVLLQPQRTRPLIFPGGRGARQRALV
jgi:threonine dehydrogenase-like Zn-dependent dehydrogenase